MNDPKPILNYHEPEGPAKELPADPDANWQRMSELTGRHKFSFWILLYIVALIGIVAYVISIFVGLARHAGVW